MRVIDGGNDVAVARELVIGGVIALIVAKGAMGEKDEGEARFFLRLCLGIVEIYGHLAEAADLFIWIDPRAVNQDGGGSLDSIFAAGGQALVVGEQIFLRKLMVYSPFSADFSSLT
jgi:hypothetical protein